MLKLLDLLWYVSHILTNFKPIPRQVEPYFEYITINEDLFEW